MRKLLLFLTLMVTMCCTFLCNAKVVNFHTNDIDATYMIYMKTEYNPVIIEWNADGTATATIPDNKGVNVNLNTGYVSQYIAVNGENVVTSFIGSFYLTPEMLPDGCSVEIMTSVKQQINVTIKGDIDQIKVKYMYHEYEAYEWDNGSVTIPITDTYMNVQIEARDGYGLKSVMHDNVNVLENGIHDYTIYSNNLSAGDNVYEVNSFLLEDERTSSFTVDVTGDPDSVEIVRAGDTNNILTGAALSEPIMFNPDFDLPLIVSSTRYGQMFYKVIADGVEIPAENYQYRIYDLKDGGTVKITVDYPVVQIPVRFDFVNPETEGAIAYIRVNTNGEDKLVPDGEWAVEGWSVPMGATVSIALDVTDFEITSYLNGIDVNAGHIQFIAEDEAGYDIRIVAEPREPFEVIFSYESLPAHFKVLIGSTGEDYVEMTGEDSTTVSVPRNRNRVRIIPDEGWVIQSIVVDGHESNSDDIPVTGTNMYIDVYMEEFVRDLEAVFYLDPATDWDYKSITLSSEASFREKAISLEDGYNVVKYNEADLPIALDILYQSQYDYICFLNGEQLPTPVVTLDEFTPGSVVRCYGEYPDFYQVKFTIKDDASVTVYRDIIDEIEVAGELEVMSGTRFDIIPGNSDEVSVTINGVGQTIQDGKYVVTADSELDIEIAPKNLSGVDTIDSDGHYDVFSLQGIRILKNATRKQIDELPAGLYITRGKKLIIK